MKPVKSLKIIVSRGLASLKKARKNAAKFRKVAFPLSIGLLIILIPVLYLTFRNPGKVLAAWWSKTEGGSTWQNRKQLNVTNNSSALLSAGTTIAITVNTQELYRLGKLKADCSDLRVVRAVTATTFAEVARFIEVPGNSTCAYSTNTKVYFQIASSLAAGASVPDYYMYYGNPNATAPSSTETVFNVGSKVATLVCPFDGSTTCAGSETPTTETSITRFTGSKSAISFNGINNYTTATASSTMANSMDNTGTIEAWVYFNPITDAGSHTIARKSWNLQTNQSGGNFRIDFIYDRATTPGEWTTPYSIAPNQWTHIAVVYNPTSTSNNPVIYINGVSQTVTRSQTPAGTRTDDTATGLNIGGQATYFSGYVDEFRYSTTARYVANFTPSTSSFVRDAYTAVLYHYDENGDDPRTTGKTIDDSGNANNGTITGAKYIAGYVGIDGSSPNTGNVYGQSYASHGGVVVEEGTTNKVLNPSFENTTYNTNWTLSGGVGSDNTTAPYYKYGSHSYKIVLSTTTDQNLYTSINVGNTNTHTLSAYVYRGTSGNIGGTVNATIAKLYWQGTAQTTVYTDMGGGWWLLTYTAAGTNSSQNYGVTVVENSGTLYVDGIQLEEKGHASSYADGSLGSAYSWDTPASPNNSTSTRALSNLRYNVNNISLTAGTVSMWIKSSPTSNIWQMGGQVYTHLDTSDGWGCKGINIRNEWSILYTDFYTSGCTGVEIQSNTSTYSTNAWYHIVATYNSGGTALYINGAQVGTGAGVATLNEIFDPTFGGTPVLGGFISNSGEVISDVRIYTSALTSTEVSDLYNTGLVSHTEDVSVDAFTEAKGQNAVGIWHFDEGGGPTAGDSSGYGNNLTINPGATWNVIPNGNTNKLAKNMHFNGTSGYLYRQAETDFNVGSGSFTLATWFQHSAVISGTDTILANYSSGGWKVYMNSSGYICVGVDDDATWGPNDSACTSSAQGSFADNKWHHLEVVKNGTTSLTVYIDGAQAATSSVTSTGSLNSTSGLYIGSDVNLSNYWDGDLDEMYMFKYARTATQVKSDYSSVQGAANFGTDTSNKSSDSGLLGYWKMDEKSWNGTLGEAKDSSGIGNDATRVGNAATTTGKYGSGGTFDGTGDYLETTTVSVNNPLQIASGPITLGAWIKPTGTTGAIIWGGHEDGNYGNYALYHDNGHIGFLFRSADGNNDEVYQSTNTYTLSDKWHYAAITYTFGNGASMKLFLDGVVVPGSWALGDGNVLPWETHVVRIGDRGTSAHAYYTGKIDEVRIYNRALSDTEIKQLYTEAPGPVGYWKLDEGSGTSAYDSSGNNFTGTLNGATFWTNSCVFGSCIGTKNANNVLDYVNVPSQTKLNFTNKESYTLEAYVKHVAKENGTAVLINKGATTYSTAGYDMEIDSNGHFYCGYVDGNGSGIDEAVSTTIASTTKFQHVACVMDRDGSIAGAAGLYVVVDGIPEGADTNLTEGDGGTSDTSPLVIGDGVDTAWESGDIIDDVKVYNYAREVKQITQDLNGGHSAPGSPVGSAALHWNFENSYGDSVPNLGNLGTALNGDINGASASCPTTGCPGPTKEGRLGVGMSFPGTSWVESANNAAFNSSPSFTISAWFKRTGAVDSSDGAGVAGRWQTSEGAFIWIVPVTNEISFPVGAGPHLGSGVTAALNTWYHVVGTYDSTSGNSSIYVNGVKKATQADAPNLSTITQGFEVGQYAQASTTRFTGIIDEVKYYTFALTDDQVKLEYNNGSAEVWGSSGTSSAGVPSYSATSEYCVPGDTSTCKPPVGEWRFEENAGTSAYDTSGNNNKSSSFLGSPKWSPGKIGSGLKFDGSTQAVVINDSSSLHLSDFTLETWVKPNVNNVAQGLISKRESWTTMDWELYLGSSSEIDMIIGEGANAVSIFGACTYTAGQWNHLVAVKSGSSYTLYKNGVACDSGTTSVTWTDSEKIALGAIQPTGEFSLNGVLDETKIYNYARTPAQVAWDYNRGKPVAWYKFNECSGTTVYNSALNSNDQSSGMSGTIHPNTGRSAGTCQSGTSTEMWNGGTNGKFQGSLAFDGSGDYIEVPDSSDLNLTGSYTLSAWIKPQALPQYTCIIERGINVNSRYYIWLGDADVLFGVNNSFHSFPAHLTIGNWSLITAVHDSQTDTDTVYKDGNLVASYGGSTTDPATSGVLRIGQPSNADYQGAYFMNGQLDDIRVYNYALNETQVKSIYNEDAAIRFGP